MGDGIHKLTRVLPVISCFRGVSSDLAGMKMQFPLRRLERRETKISRKFDEPLQKMFYDRVDFGGGGSFVNPFPTFPYLRGSFGTEDFAIRNTNKGSSLIDKEHFTKIA